MAEPIHLLDEQSYNPPRRVEVELHGQWWPGFQRARLLISERDFWVADVEFSAPYAWGFGKHLLCVPTDRLRLTAEAAPAP